MVMFSKNKQWLDRKYGDYVEQNYFDDAFGLGKQ